MSMKKTVSVIFILVFAVAMFHFFYGEEHGSVRFPSAVNAFNGVPHHHGDASTCLCCVNILFVPEPDAWDGAADFRSLPVPGGESRVLPSLGADILHPPNSFLL